MTLNNPYSSYQTTQTVTAGQTKLIVMLHDGAIRFLAQAAMATSRQDYNQKAIFFNKANAIIEHLWGTLDREQGGEIAENLENIYAYMHSQLSLANENDDIKIIKQIMTHLRDIREAWAQVDEQTRTRPPAEEPVDKDAELLMAA